MSVPSVLKSPHFPHFGDDDARLPASLSSNPYPFHNSTSNPNVTTPTTTTSSTINKSLWRWFQEFMVEVKRARRNSMLTFIVEEESEHPTITNSHHTTSHNASSSANMSLATYRRGDCVEEDCTAPSAAASGVADLTTPFSQKYLKRAFSAPSITDDGFDSSGHNNSTNTNLRNSGGGGQCPSSSLPLKQSCPSHHFNNISSAQGAAPLSSSGGTTQRSRRGETTSTTSKLTESIKAMGRAELEDHMEKAVRLIFQLIKHQTATPQPPYSTNQKQPPPPQPNTAQNGYQFKPLSAPLPVETPQKWCSDPLDNTLLSTGSSISHNPYIFVGDHTLAPPVNNMKSDDDNDNDDNDTTTSSEVDDDVFSSSSFGSEGYHRITSFQHPSHHSRRRSTKKSIKESRGRRSDNMAGLTSLLTRPTVNAQFYNSFDIDDLIDSGSMIDSTDFIRHVMVKKERDLDGKRVLNGYVFVGEIGSGAYGRVRLAYERGNQHKKYAVKSVPRCGGLLGRRVLEGRESQQQQLQNQEHSSKEVAIMKALRHKNIVNLHAVVDDPEADKVYMVMDYIEGGTLLEEETSTSKRADGFIYKPLPEEVAVKYMRQLVGALRYLHKHRIAHRDIKPANILRRKSEDTVYIADFGTAELGTYSTTMEDLNMTFSASVERSVLTDEPLPGTPIATLMIKEIENGGNGVGGSLSFNTADYEPDNNNNHNTTPSTIKPSTTTTSTPLTPSAHPHSHHHHYHRCHRRPLAVYGQKGTPMFWSPEMFRATESEYFVDGEAQDTWALGVTLYMMLTGKSPFKSTQFYDLKQEIGGPTEIAIPDTLSVTVQCLLRSMLHKDIHHRCTLLHVRESSLLLDAFDGDGEVYSGSLLGNLVPPLTLMHNDGEEKAGDSIMASQFANTENHTPRSQNASVAPSTTSSYRHLLLPPVGIAAQTSNDDESVCPSSCTLAAAAPSHPPSHLSSPLCANNHSTSHASGGYSSPTRHTQRVVVSPLISDGSGFDVGGAYNYTDTNMSPQHRHLLTTSTTLCGSISRSIRSSGGGGGASDLSPQNNPSSHSLPRN